MYEPRQKPICMCTDSRSQKQQRCSMTCDSPSWGTLTIAIFHRIFTHPKWLGQIFFFFCFGGRLKGGGGGGGGENNGVDLFFVIWKTMAWWSLVTCYSHDLALMFRKLFLDGKKCFPHPPALLAPFVFHLFAFSSSSTDVRTCALHNIVVMKRLCLEGGGHP
jgi:hypothetical protein